MNVQAAKPFVALASILLVACGTPPISDGDRASIRQVSISPKVAVPPFPQVIGPSTSGTAFLLGPIALAAMMNTENEDSSRFKQHLAQNDIAVADIVRAEFAKQLAQGKGWSLVDAGADATFEIVIESYGLGPGFSMAPINKPLRPTLRMNAKLLAKDGKLLWEKTEYITGLSDLPTSLFDEYLNDASRTREAMKSAAALVVQALLADLSEKVGFPMARAAAVSPVAAEASVAPASGNRLPLPGDTWTYQFHQPGRLDGPKHRSYVVRVASASQGEIRDELLLDNQPSGAFVHSNGSYLVGQGAPVFSPYLMVFAQAAMRIGDIGMSGDGGCMPPYGCTAKGHVAGGEALTTPAGTFETIKVVVVQSWQPTGMTLDSTQRFGSRTLTVWYAPALKRAVKFSSKKDFGDIPPFDADFTLELVSYQLK